MPTYKQLRPTPRNAAIAQSAYEALSRYGGTDGPLTLRAGDNGQERPIDLPAGAVDLLMHVLKTMAAGQGVMVIPEHVELTTAQAADILNVSRPFLIKLLDLKEIPHRSVGRHRRIRVEDVMAYKNAIDRERDQALERLTREAQAHDMGYDAR